MFLRQILFAFCIGWSMVACAGQSNFACPAGMHYKKHVKPGDDLQFEWCTDDQERIQGIMRVTVLSDGRIDGLVPYVNGKKHGVGIMYDAAGDPAYEVTYENGVKKSSRLTRQALVKIAEEVSADAEKRHKAWRARVINERTILYEVRAHVTKPERVTILDPKDFPAAAKTQFCNMFAIPDSLWDAVEVHYINDDGELIQTGTFRPSDCSGGT